MGKQIDAKQPADGPKSDGNDLAALDAALDEAVADTTRPTLILVRTHIGYGSPKQDSFKAHGSPLGVEDVKLTKENLGWPLEPDFLVPEPALKHFREAQQRCLKAAPQMIRVNLDPCIDARVRIVQIPHFHARHELSAGGSHHLHVLRQIHDRNRPLAAIILDGELIHADGVP